MNDVWTGNDYSNGWCSISVIGIQKRLGPEDLELSIWTEDDARAGRCLGPEVGQNRGAITPRKAEESPPPDPLEDVLDVGLQLFYANPQRFIADHPSVYIKLLSAELEVKKATQRSLSSYGLAELDGLSTEELRRLAYEDICTCPVCGTRRDILRPSTED